MALKLTTSSALNLILEGSAGQFSVGNPAGRDAVDVKYFLTHVGLNFESGGASEEVLKHLAPVREVFPAQTLDDPTAPQHKPVKYGLFYNSAHCEP